VRSSEAAFNYREALRLLPEARRTGVEPFEIRLALADVYEYEGAHTAVVEAQREALLGAGDDAQRRKRALSRQAAYALAIDDATGAADRIRELQNIDVAGSRTAIPLRQAPTPDASLLLLRARLALAMEDPLAALDNVERGLEATSSPADRARLLDQSGEACARLFRFEDAGSSWDSAAAAFDQVGGELAAASAARYALLSLRMTALAMGHLKAANLLIESASMLRGMDDAQLYAELQLVRTYLAHRAGEQNAAHEIFSRLLEPRRPPWPAPLRARILTFGLIFGMLGEEDFDDTHQAIADVQPLTLRESLLDWAQYSDDGANVDPGAVLRLLGLFAASTREASAPRARSARVVQSYIYRADLCRVLKNHGEAGAQLARAASVWKASDSAADVLQWWRLNLARERLDVPTDYRDVLDRVSATGLKESPIADAIRCKAGMEALRSGDLKQARSIANAGFPRIEHEPLSIWQARILELKARIDRSDVTEALRQQAMSQYRDLGQDAVAASLERTDASPRVSQQPPAPEPPPASEPLQISDDNVPEPIAEAARHPELAIDRFMKDWAEVAFELSACLQRLLPGAKVESLTALRAAGRVAALPWELAPVLANCEVVWRTSEHPPRVDLPLGQGVHLVRPEVDERELTFEAQSGGQLEEIYTRGGVRPSVSFNPDPVHLESELTHNAPAVIHIVAAIRESTGGMSLDFESSETRASVYADQETSKQAPRRSPSELHFTTTRLDRVLMKLRQPPFVILDVARPKNMVEALRMLLLRNVFAAQLFEMGHVRGLLACGLAQPWERFEFTRMMVFALLEHGLPGAMSKLRPPSERHDFLAQKLEHVLPRFAAALWTGDPADRVANRQATSS
jgi:hypothetical protein